MQITLRYGVQKSIIIEVPEGTTIRQAMNNPGAKLYLGFPENVSAVIDGTTVSLDDEANDGDVIQLEKQAAAKAA